MMINREKVTIWKTCPKCGVWIILKSEALCHDCKPKEEKIPNPLPFKIKKKTEIILKKVLIECPECGKRRMPENAKMCKTCHNYEVKMKIMELKKQLDEEYYQKRDQNAKKEE